MPEPLAPPPPAAPPAPAAPLPNPVLPPNAGMQGVPYAISPLERASAELAGQPQPPTGYDPNVAASLEEARARDRGDRGTLPPPQPAAPAHPADPNASTEPLLKPRVGRAEREKLRANDWQSIKARAETAEAELARLRAQPAIAPNGDLDFSKVSIDALRKHPEFARIEQERNTFYEEVKGVRAEADPEFKAKWDARSNAIMGAVKRVSGKAAEEVVEILRDTNPDRRMAALAERIKDFGDGSKTQIIAAAAQLSAMEIERDIDLQTRKATWEAAQASRQQADRNGFAQRLATIEKEFDHVWAEACHPESGIPFLMDDKIKAAILPDARRVLTGESNAREIARASLNAALLPHVIKSAQAAWQEVERLQASMGNYEAAWPDTSHVPVGDLREQADRTPALNVAGYDGHFGSGIEAARQRDLQGRR